MDLRKWRQSQRMTLAQAADVLALAIATISVLERGDATVSRETLARIDGATGGKVTANDLNAAFRAEFEGDYSKHHAAGRAAMAAFRKSAKPKPKLRGSHGTEKAEK